jgi:hypothetical protein
MSYLKGVFEKTIFPIRQKLALVVGQSVVVALFIDPADRVKQRNMRGVGVIFHQDE